MPDKIIAGGGLISNERNELLMIFRKGKWDLPKGKLDEGETIEQCALREVQEETGLSNVVIEKFVGITYHNYNNYHNRNKATVKETHWFAMHAAGEQTFTPQKEESIELIEWADDAMLEKHLQSTYANITEIINKWKAMMKK